MMATLLGPDRLRKGTDLYFARHDGEAATCEDFVRAMEEGGDIDLSQFRRWYEPAGTPKLLLDLAQSGGERFPAVQPPVTPYPGGWQRVGQVKAALRTVRLGGCTS